MEKQDLIKEINKEKYDFSKPETSLDNSDYKEGYNDASDDILDIVKKLDEPQKVKVPLFVAKWISKCRELNWILPDLLAPEAFESSFARNTEEWLRQDKQNYDILARAWLEGYEVEEEPKYQVKLKFGRQYLSKNADGNMLDFYSCMVFPPSFSKKELESIEDGAFYKADGDKEWINPIIELVPVEKV
ncbi:DUF1642 domain-containing protein [Enterococcus avium]|uniref:DUF1642 domain-containing protein n=1 Tax=Enterococcus avium TaxID=33945 RepID=UPI00288D9B6F|nr:DUF1642 domain-containing protein [Enterococcus avium]MDT2395108.1 DUF1642 domain-containing protein [Enterococcus avium]MDT2441397.1 DUF1642 domain-containing protein [Enterococcus avium]MDT2454317.1 DUF1642 domain-containing protein [Enterococcus avium]